MCAALLLSGWWVLTGTDVREVTREPNGALAHKQSTNALVGGCGPLYTYPSDVVTSSSGTVAATDRMGKPNWQQYQTTVPIFGRFWNAHPKEGQRFWETGDKYAPYSEQLLREQWDGALVVYYTDDVSATEVKTLRDILRLRPDLDIYVVPWEERVRGLLPRGREIAFATWNATQTCHQLVAPALYDFRNAYPSTAAPGAKGKKPKVLSTTPPLNVPVIQ